MSTSRSDAPAEPIRPPAVAGRFYPASGAALGREVEAFLGAAGAGRAVVAAMAPHAGYVYSGGVAGRLFGEVAVPGRVIVLAPNHTGRGRPIAVAARGTFRLPGRDVPIDAELAAAVLAEVEGAEADLEAHRGEHAVEVELPFLVARRPDVRVVPIVLGPLSEAAAIAVGVGLARAVARLGAGDDVLVLASSDMSHYLPDGEARVVDKVALGPLLDGDAGALYRTVRDGDISMCGVIPATAMLAYAAARGDAGPPELVAYATSGDAFGDRERVVGYAAVVIPRVAG
jgi:AmmeMemoRadiSam system protein B